MRAARNLIVVSPTAETAKTRRKFLQFVGAAATAPAFSRIARAQAFPSRPITIIVPFPAGGPPDAIARIMAERMQVSLGQPVIIENVGGANGGTGTGRLARATPDGYTLGLGVWNTHVANGAMYALRYDVQNDFEPVALLASFSALIAARKTLPANDLQELISWLKTNPDKAASGHPGVGSLGHLVGIFFQNLTATRFQQVPYRGIALAIQDLVAGQIDLAFPDANTSVSQFRAGNIKIFAVVAKNRLPAASDIPTSDEAGLPGFHAANWSAFWVPRGTSKDIVGKLNAAVVAALADTDVRQKMVAQGFEILPPDQQTPEALSALQKAEIGKWWPIIKAANVKAE
jgi:tripartite-type tricarboxylate transporter receptor subunit TctC